jgi:hypothetical protein
LKSNKVCENSLLISEDLMFGIIGAIAATLIAFSGANVIVVVMGAIGTLVLNSMFFT